ncbi:hypothetical protein K437DRAFT_274137 [Tilletiaria anomala UBC 951]|uniref:Uncharacterized protein n=1 Tax=Tilletiaria anomala (strain ATCC 24038 / CBS 436.72 / UBC 951) TaxID=1037660 RepID=A0A066VVI5_TILAU|nr:uncharacterized protein K437DRAFT_274137 [Tilletiaria anomala UBC 951]KDN45737.1 hypothetical protein K437DRAFT_274137 [Tilletiaria anomala UBC 951]
MQFSDKQNGVDLQVVHGPGATYVKHPTRGCPIDIVLTGGDDYLVRALPSLGNDDSFTPVTMEEATMQISWIDVDSYFIITSSEDGCVRVYTINIEPSTGESVWVMDSLLTRSTLPVRCAAIERNYPTGKAPRIAVASDELIVKVINLEDPLNVDLLTGHMRSVRHCAWSPTAPILLTSGCDGIVRVWDMGTNGEACEPICTQIIKDLLVTTRATDTERATQTLWHPTGKFFLIPGKTNEIIIMGPSATNPGQWERKQTFNGHSPTIDPPVGAVTAMDFSPNGRYLATATAGNGQVTVWDTATRAPIKRRLSEANVTSISWNMRRNALCWTDLGGSLYRWEDVISPGSASPCDLLPGQEANIRMHPSVEEEEALAPQVHRESKRLVDMNAAGADLGHDDAVSDDNDDDDMVSLVDFVVDDAGGDYARDLERERLQRHAGRLKSGKSMSGLMVQGTPSQPAFQVTSTPMRSQRRFLAFNTLGTLIAVDQDNHQSILFESYDTAARRNYRIQDQHKFSMASLASHGALFACEENERDRLASTVFFKPFDNLWGAYSTEWSFDLPKGESAVCVAMSGPCGKPEEEENASDAASTAALVATSAGYVRIFSASGLQRFIWHLGASVVTMVAGSHTAMIVTRGPGAALGGYQNLNYTLLDMQTLATVNHGSLPLPKDTTLQWAGFNEYDTPAIFDSRGVLSVLDGSRSGPNAKWVPSLDVRSMPEAPSTAELKYWPVSVVSNKLLVIMLKGAMTMPDAAAARPLVQELDLALPVLDNTSPTSRHEEAWLRQALLASMVRSRPPALLDAELNPDAIEQNADKALLQLIQLSCKSDKHKKAIDAARELHTTRTLDAALKIAQYFGLASLADRMEGLREFVETRKERVEEAGHAYSSGIVIAAPRILVPESQESRAAAKQALTEDFAPRAPKVTRRGFGGGFTAASSSLASAAAAAAATSSFRSSPAFSVATTGSSTKLTLKTEIEMEERALAEAEAQEAVRTLQADRSANENQEAESMEGEHQVGRLGKRKIGEDFVLPAKKSNNPFLTNKPANPFAKTASGSHRERSMHKSNSFFDRVDAVEGTGMTIAERARKQSTLFGFASSKVQKKKPDANKQQSTSPAATPAFADTQLMDDVEGTMKSNKKAAGIWEDAEDQVWEKEIAEEESLRLTLQAARRMEHESVALEETQLTGAADETQNEQMQEEGDKVNAAGLTPMRPTGGERDVHGEHADEDETNTARFKLEAFRAPAISPAA